MDYLEPKDLNEIQESVQSGSDSVNKENIFGGYNAYDNILKLVDIRTITFEVADQEYDPELGTIVFETEDSFLHGLDQTPFVDVEWRDPSNVGGSSVTNINMEVTYDHREVNYHFTLISEIFGEGPFDPYPGDTYKLRLFFYLLNTKRRLDTYVK